MYELCVFAFSRVVLCCKIMNNMMIRVNAGNCIMHAQHHLNVLDLRVYIYMLTIIII